MNILQLTGVDGWKNKALGLLIRKFENFISDNYLENRLMLSYNPLMSIALTAEILNKIGAQRKRYRDKCNAINEQLMSLGKMYAGKIEDEEYYKGIIQDTDFSGRSVLCIICDCGFQPLMCEEDPKAENIISQVWNG